jgi:hypothetical protein
MTPRLCDDDDDDEEGKVGEEVAEEDADADDAGVDADADADAAASLDRRMAAEGSVAKEDAMPFGPPGDESEPWFSRSMDERTVEASVLAEPDAASPSPAPDKRDRSRLFLQVSEVRVEELAEGEAEVEQPVRDKRWEAGDAAPELPVLIDRALSVLETASREVGLAV